MKIAFVFPPMWSPHSDGSLQIWNRQVTTHLSKSCDVLVYSGLFGLKSDENIDGVQYRRFSTRWDNGFLKQFRFIRGFLGVNGPLFKSDLWYAGYYLRVALDLRRKACDIVHVHYYPQFASLIKRLNPKLRVILHMHGEWLTQVKFNNLNSRLRQIDLVVSCSGFITKSIVSRFPQIASRCRTVPMGVSADFFSIGSKNRRADNSSSLHLLCVGRISPEKGIHILLDAFELIIRKFPNIALTIVGPEWVAPREDITDLSLEEDIIAGLAPFYSNSYLVQLKRKLSPDAAKRVTFAGLVAHRDVPAFYKEADIYIGPSLYESFGVSIIEAMTAGVPVVATRVGAVPEVISEGESGLVVDSNNPRAIADAVVKLLTNSQLRNSMSFAAREMIWKRFSWETICSALVETYLEVLDHRTVSLDQAESVAK
jgi:glycosyltransferase involved in cell wall biosynthesis